MAIRARRHDGFACRDRLQPFRFLRLLAGFDPLAEVRISILTGGLVSRADMPSCQRITQSMRMPGAPEHLRLRAYDSIASLFISADLERKRRINR